MLAKHQRWPRIAGLRSESVRKLSRLVATALDLLLPPRCAVCHREGRYLCAGCEAGLPRLEMLYCTRCAGPGRASLCSWCTAVVPPFEGIKAPYRMQAAVSEIVYGLKYRNLPASAPELAGLLTDRLGVQATERNQVGLRNGSHSSSRDSRAH